MLADLNFFGSLFDAFVVRDLHVFADVVDGTVQHYRDSDNLEIEAVVTAGDGRWAAFEVTIGRADIDMAAANLLAFARKIDTTPTPAHPPTYQPAPVFPPAPRWVEGVGYVDDPTSDPCGSDGSATGA